MSLGLQSARRQSQENHATLADDNGFHNLFLVRLSESSRVLPTFCQRRVGGSQEKGGTARQGKNNIFLLSAISIEQGVRTALAAAGPITRYPSDAHWIFRLSVDDTKAGYVIARYAIEECSVC